MKSGIRAASAVAAGAAAITLLGLAAPAQAAPVRGGAEQSGSVRAAASPAFAAALAEVRNVASPDYCHPHANNGGCH